MTIRALHLVSAKTLKSIQRDKVLMPKTPFYQDEEDRMLYGKPKKDFAYAVTRKYICAIPM